MADSLHYHPAQYSVFYKREWDVKQDWKVYFFIRNKAFVFNSRYSSKVKGFLTYLYFLLAFAGTIFFYQRKNKMQKLSLLVKAGKDGIQKNTSNSISHIRAYLTTL